MPDFSQRPSAPTIRRAADAELFKRAQTGDAAALEELVRFFMPMAKRIARATRSQLVESEDLEQVAYLALVLAIKRFDPSRGLAFGTFALPTISGEIKRHLRDRGWSVRVPRSLQEDALRIRKATAELIAARGRAPTARELAARTEVPIERVLEAIEAGSALSASSLDATDRDPSGESTPVLERLGEDDSRFAIAEELASISPSLRELPQRDRLILYLRFAEDRTQSEIALRSASRRCTSRACSGGRSSDSAATTSRRAQRFDLRALLRSAAGISALATALVRTGIWRSMNFAIRSSSRRIWRAIFAVSASPISSASVSIAM